MNISWDQERIFVQHFHCQFTQSWDEKSTLIPSSPLNAERMRSFSLTMMDLFSFPVTILASNNRLCLIHIPWYLSVSEEVICCIILFKSAFRRVSYLPSLIKSTFESYNVHSLHSFLNINNFLVFFDSDG